MRPDRSPEPLSPDTEAALPLGTREPGPGFVPSEAALDAAARVRALYETAVAFADQIEAQMMEALHFICGEVGNLAFDAFVAQHTPLRPVEARRMVETWDVARKQRDLRELARNRPREAMSLVRTFVDAGADSAQIDAFGTDDKAVAEVLALPPRRRNARIRELVHAEAAAMETPGRPADREEIRMLTAERDALARALAAATPSRDEDPNLASLRTLVDDTARLESELSASAAHFSALGIDGGEARGDSETAAQMQRLVRLMDGLRDTADRVSDRAIGFLDSGDDL